MKLVECFVDKKRWDKNLAIFKETSNHLFNCINTIIKVRLMVSVAECKRIKVVSDGCLFFSGVGSCILLSELIVDHSLPVVSIHRDSDIFRTSFESIVSIFFRSFSHKISEMKIICLNLAEDIKNFVSNLQLRTLSYSSLHSFSFLFKITCSFSIVLKLNIFVCLHLLFEIYTIK